MIKKLFLFSVLILFVNCGYESVYVKKDNSLIKIGKINLKGDKKINRKILSSSGIKETSNITNSYLLVLNSEKNKEIVSKNSAGNATSYKISINVDISIIDPIDGKIIKSKMFNSSFTYNNNENKFQLSQDEKNILNNLIESTSKKVVFYLSL
tara:strand:- start:209 stop:667 length:459 start_codon:yes stop_codon:yes gene_type:complete